MENEVIYDVLRDLVTEWQTVSNKQEKEKLFNKILQRIDKLLLSKVWILAKSYPRLHNVDVDDLYQTACIALYNSLSQVKDNHTGNQILTIITRNIREEVRKTYMKNKTEIITQSLDDIDPDTIIDEQSEFTSLDADDLATKVNELITKGIIPREDYELFVEHVIGEKTYKNLGEQKGIHWETVKKRIEKVKILLRRELI